MSIKHGLPFIFVFILFCLSCSKTIFNVPLDQRFTTRIAFLNIAKITPYQIISLPDKYLPSLKAYSNPTSIMGWAFQNGENADFGILSFETLIYGSLIASRISNDTFDQVNTRLNELVSWKVKHPNLKLYCSSVIMRIPHYNGDFQQPWYWAQYGQPLYTYSFYCSKFKKTKNPQDQQICNQTRAKIPPNIIEQFIWRRERNHNITLKIINLINTDRSLFKRFYITLDDSAQFGMNAQQANEVIGLVNKYGIQNIVKIYPGADQVSLTLLTALSVDQSGLSPPVVSMFFRNITTVGYIPNYEGLPMIQTLENQIKAAGGTPINGSILKRGNVILLVNNFDEVKQMEAPQQGPINEKNYSVFDNYICYPNKTQIVGLADNRYSNGADVFFVNYFLEKIKNCRNLTQWAYAGWNTNGNTLGTVVANSILLHLFKNSKINSKKTHFQDIRRVSPCIDGDVLCANSYFNTLRILEDKDWQVILRELTRNYIYQTPGDNINNLTNDLPFYQKFVFKSMLAKQKILQSQLGLNFTLSGAYFPWNRTFEIGLFGVLNNQESALAYD